MIVMLLRNYGFGGGVAVDPTVPVDNSDIEFQPLPMFLAIAQLVNHWLYAILTPLKFRPLVYDLRANRLQEDGGQSSLTLSMAGQEKVEFTITLRARGWLRAFALAAFATGALAVGLNYAVLGTERASAMLSYRDHFQAFPGTAVAAVGWVICIVALAMHVLIVCIYEYMRNPSQAATFGVHLAGVVLLASALLAHASIVPGDQQSYNWFRGAEAFQLALAAWVGLQVRLGFSQRADEEGPKESAKMVDVFLGFTTIVFIVVALATGWSGDGELYYDIFSVFMIFAFSFADPRNISLSFKDIRVASDAEALVALEDHSGFVGVPFFNVDFHGIKDVLKESVGEKGTST